MSGRPYACIGCHRTVRRAPYCDACLTDMHSCAWPNCLTLLRGDYLVCRFHALGRTTRDLAMALERAS
jgi:hypothetical protein